ncbi:MAG: SCO family protein [Chloroflexi bacterium]|nr:SCO family protein [Chloroflexota bacterium]
MIRRIGWTLVLLLVSGSLGCRANALPVKPSAAWSLTSQDGVSFGSRDLRGKVALVTFVYTHCATVCPLLSAQMKQLQDEFGREGAFGSRLVFVSVTVDPPRDTPARLKEYAGQFGVDLSGWTWLTGEPAQLETLWRSFEVVAYPDLATMDAPLASASHAGHGTSVPANYAVVHTTKTVLLDGAGNLRAEYIGVELPRARVAQDIRALLAELDGGH